MIDAAEFFEKIFGIFNLLTCFVILSPPLSLAVMVRSSGAGSMVWGELCKSPSVEINHLGEKIVMSMGYG